MLRLSHDRHCFPPRPIEKPLAPRFLKYLTHFQKTPDQPFTGNALSMQIQSLFLTVVRSIKYHSTAYLK